MTVNHTEQEIECYCHVLYKLGLSLVPQAEM